MQEYLDKIAAVLKYVLKDTMLVFKVKLNIVADTTFIRRRFSGLKKRDMLVGKLYREIMRKTFNTFKVTKYEECRLTFLYLCAPSMGAI